MFVPSVVNPSGLLIFALVPVALSTQLLLPVPAMVVTSPVAISIRRSLLLDESATYR